MSDQIIVELNVYFQNEQKKKVYTAHEYLLDLYVQLLFRDYKVNQIDVGIHGCMNNDQ